MSTMRIAQSYIEGDYMAPPSKSAAHRALISASLSKGISKIKRVDLSKDIEATLGVIKSLGIKVILNQREDTFFDIEIYGNKNKYENIKGDFYFSESGSTLRFFIPLLLLTENSINLDGNESLRKRPLKTYFDIFEDFGISFKRLEETFLPLKVEGSLKSGKYIIRKNESSQYISGLLMALPLLDGDSEIVYETSMESNSYIDMTIDMLNKFGVDIIRRENSFKIKGRQKYKACDLEIEADYSNAAPFILMNTKVFNFSINVLNLKKDSKQGDRYITQISKILDDAIKNKKSIKLDLRENIDIAMYVILVSSFVKGEHEFKGLKRLKIKESDRLNSVIKTLDKIGIKTEIIENQELVLKVYGLENVRIQRDIEFSSFNDHRVVMMLTMLGLKLGNVSIENYEAIEKSYPHFFRDIKRLGGRIDELKYRE